MALVLAACFWAQPARAREPEPPAAQNVPSNASPPRSDQPESGSEGYSSSKRTEIDLSPPPGQPGLNLDPGTQPGDNEAQQTHPWNPHRADKDVEIGYFYYQRRNYVAAISRYRSALHWQDNHALAMFRLGQALEHVGEYAEARHYYQAYLHILPEGKYAHDASRALQKLKGKSDQPQKAESDEHKIPDL